MIIQVEYELCVSPPLTLLWAKWEKQDPRRDNCLLYTPQRKRKCTCIGLSVAMVNSSVSVLFEKCLCCFLVKSKFLYLKGHGLRRWALFWGTVCPFEGYSRRIGRLC